MSFAVAGVASNLLYLMKRHPVLGCGLAAWFDRDFSSRASFTAILTRPGQTATWFKGKTRHEVSLFFPNYIQ